MARPEYKPLREDSALADVLEAARAAGADVPDLELELAGRKVNENATVRHVEGTTVSREGFWGHSTTCVEAWVVEWERWSWYRSTTSRKAIALIDVGGGGLAPDGEAWAMRYVLNNARDEELLRQAMECALRGCVPVLACRAEL